MNMFRRERGILGPWVRRPGRLSHSELAYRSLRACSQGITFHTLRDVLCPIWLRRRGI